MRKIVIISLLIISSLLTVSSLMIHSYFLYQHKKDFNAFINNYKNSLPLTTIRINPYQLYTNTEHLVWKDDNKEILYNNTLYDIVSLDINHGIITITVINDEKEQHLEQIYSTLYPEEGSNSTQKIPYKKFIKKILSLLFLHSHCTKLSNIQNTASHLLIPVHYNLSTVYLSKLDLPPELCNSI